MEPTKKPVGRFVAVGHRGMRLSSIDGLSWSAAQFGKDGEVYRAASHGNGCFAAVGSFGGENIFGSSRDGLGWQFKKQDAGYSRYVRGVGFGNSVFLGIGGDPGSVGDSHPFIVTSTDGLTWAAPVLISGKNILRRVAYGNGRFVGVGDRGRRAASVDGRDWKDAPDVKAIDTLVDVAFGNNRFVGVGLHGLRMSSEDGLKWTNRLLGEEGEHLNQIVWAGDRFVGVGMGASFISPDGAAWKRHPNRDAPVTVAFGDGVFVGATWKGRLLRSVDGIDWKQVHKAEEHVEALAFGAG